MLTRALNAKPRKSFKYGLNKSSYGWSKSASVNEYNDSCSAVGFMEDLPLIMCGRFRDSKAPQSSSCGPSSSNDHDHCDEPRAQLSLKEVLRSSVGVLGESRVGLTEKVVLSGGRVFVLKRFRKLSVGKSEFGKRIERFSQVLISGDKCKKFVPFRAYLYAKRIKFVLCDYYPMGSLADLLSGSRQHGHTPLDWGQRLKILLNISQAIDFIHSIASKNHESNKNGIMINVHGNVKTSNVMINTDFSACLSDYGIAQLADRVEPWNYSGPSQSIDYYIDTICQKCDVYNFGLVVLDVLGGPEGTNLFVASNNPVNETKERVKRGDIKFFEFNINLSQGKERKQALQVMDIALACINNQPEARPSIEQILLYLEDVCNHVAC